MRDAAFRAVALSWGCVIYCILLRYTIGRDLFLNSPLQPLTTRLILHNFGMIAMVLKYIRYRGWESSTPTGDNWITSAIHFYLSITLEVMASSACILLSFHARTLLLTP